MNADESKVLELLRPYKDDVRHPLVVDCADWDDKIRPALAEMVYVIPYGDPSRMLNFFVTLLETVYCMGYERGRQEKSIAFHVVETGGQ